MQLLQSEWLVQMLKKSADTPAMRLLNLFSILDDWLEAPHVQHDQTNHTTEKRLQHYLVIEAAQAGAQMPELLADQLYFMALAAAQEKIEHPQSNSLQLARDAAAAMITAQTKDDTSFHIPKKAVYATAASVFLAMITGGLLYVNNPLKQAKPQQTVASIQSSARTTPTQQSNFIKTASPSQTAALFARIEQMRKGECRLLEALQLPDKYKAVYFENIVQGQISTKLEDQRIVNELLSKVRCNYTPMLMQNSRG